MKMILFYVIFLTAFTFIIYAGDNDLEGREYHFGDYESISFSKSQLIEKGYEFEDNDSMAKEYEKSYNYKLELKNKIPFLIIDKNKEEKWLILYNDFMFLAYKNDSDEPYIFGARGEAAHSAFIASHKDYYKTSSFLTEGKIKYNSDNLGSYENENPWVEGVSGYGIGEKIFIDASDFPPMLEPKKIIISNGYVSYDKPYLYEENARLKKIKVKEKNSEYEAIIELEDTPNPQVIEFPERIEDIEIEILEVYEGTKYKDTCVNFIAIILLDF